MSPSALRARCPHTCLPFPAGGGVGGRATPLCLGLAPSLRPGPCGCSCERRARCLQATAEAPGSTFSWVGARLGLAFRSRAGVLPVLGPPSEQPRPAKAPMRGCARSACPAPDDSVHRIHASPPAPFTWCLSSKLCTLPERRKRRPRERRPRRATRSPDVPQTHGALDAALSER